MSKISKQQLALFAEIANTDHPHTQLVLFFFSLFYLGGSIPKIMKKKMEKLTTDEQKMLCHQVLHMCNRWHLAASNTPSQTTLAEAWDCYRCHQVPKLPTIKRSDKRKFFVSLAEI